MFGLELTAIQLAVCLAGIEPVQLTSVTLLRQHAPPNGSLFPLVLDRDVIRQATLELVSYTKRCRELVKRLHDLPPVPLKAVCIPEYGL